MAITRADRYTALQKKQIYYSDFPTNFNLNPFSGDLAVLTNEDSVKQSIRNLVITQLGERLYDARIGSDAAKNLFENFMPITEQNIVLTIQNCISFNEPRAVLQGVSVNPNPDLNTYTVFIVFSLVNDTTPITIQMVLTRVR